MNFLNTNDPARWLKTYKTTWEVLQNLETKIESKCLMFCCLFASSKHFFHLHRQSKANKPLKLFSLENYQQQTRYSATQTPDIVVFWTSPSAPQYIFHVFDIFNENSNTKNIFTCYFPSSCCNLEVFNTNGEIKRRTTFCEVHWGIKKALLEGKVSRKVNR